MKVHCGATTSGFVSKYFTLLAIQLLVLSEFLDYQKIILHLEFSSERNLFSELSIDIVIIIDSLC